MGSADMADDLEALRTHLRLSEISILGHSNSDAIALSYAIESGVCILLRTD
jgi:proline iminopeptidase